MKTLKDYEYFKTDLGVLYHGDCLDILPLIDDPIDMILCDLPYGTTACSWDIVIPFEPLWREYKRLIIDNGAVVLTGSQPFTTDLINSNREWFKYQWIWIKNKVSGLIKTQPVRSFEDILIFYNKFGIYNEIPTKRTEKEYKLCYREKDSLSKSSEHRPNYKNILIRKSAKEQWYKKPLNILEINSSDCRDGNGHPTKKPIALFEYLIKTYTNKEMKVLDNCLGGGTTAIACEKLNRRWIGIEISEKYCAIAKQKIKAEADQIKMEFTK